MRPHTLRVSPHCWIKESQAKPRSWLSASLQACYFTPSSILEGSSRSSPVHFYTPAWVWAGPGCLASSSSSSVGIAIKARDKEQMVTLLWWKKQKRRWIEVYELATGQIWAPGALCNHEKIQCCLEMYQSSDLSFMPVKAGKHAIVNFYFPWAEAACTVLNMHVQEDALSLKQVQRRMTRTIRRLETLCQEYVTCLT